MIYYWYYWTKSDSESDITKIEYQPLISVIIIGRNEADNIKNCIQNISDNNYPNQQFEIIYIDDFSTDNSLDVLNSISIENFNFYKLSTFIGERQINNYKKVAIRHAISKAKGDIIIQTDADTIVGENWIKSHVQYYNNPRNNFLTAPVLYLAKNNSLEQFQKYDILTTIGVTSAGIRSGLHYMANGANMSYRKKVFNEVNSDSKYASGDDMFLIQDIVIKYPNSVQFLKNRDAVVYTYPETTLSNFYKQRLRWATKTNSYKNINMKLVVLLVFLINLICFSNVVLILFWGIQQLYFTLFIITIKLSIDYLFITSVAKFFKEKTKLTSLITSLLRYPSYIISIGVFSLFIKKYNWKGRYVK